MMRRRCHSLTCGGGSAVIALEKRGFIKLVERQNWRFKNMTWEYIVREFNVQDSGKILLLEEFLNEVGKDGWELVSVATTPTEAFTHLVYLKRGSVLVDRVGLAPL
jgi:hypothetical protein